MKRRQFITLLGGAAFAWPLDARAQQPTMPVIGGLSSFSSKQFESRLVAFHGGLRESGYVEGQNVKIEFHWVAGQNDRLPELAADLVRRRVAVIVTNGAPSTLAAKAATTSIPIVFAGGLDPVGLGLVSSLNCPGGNITGVSALNSELTPKRLELLHELIPAAKMIALLVNPTNPVSEAVSASSQTAARTLGLTLHVLRANSGQDLDAVFSSIAGLHADALVIGTDGYFNDRSDQLAALSLRYSVPAIYQYREFVAAGGLMSYGDSSMDNQRHVGIYAGRILKGEKPAELPVQQSTKVELIINLKTIKALGLHMPLSLIGRADEVIE